MNIEQWLGEENKLGIDIWKGKYQYENESFDEWLDRVSGGDEDVKRLIIEKKFLFGGRILANRGLGKHGVKTTYSNCFLGDTEIVTSKGNLCLDELVNQDEVTVWSEGKWRKATVKCFGNQEIWCVALTKVFHSKYGMIRKMSTLMYGATADHIWFINDNGVRREVRTSELIPGMELICDTPDGCMCEGGKWVVDAQKPFNTKNVCPVYCAVVPETNSFTLASGILTHNCYVVSPPEDNIESIFDCAKRLARTYSYGGGVGIDISNLAPRGAKVHNTAKETTGSVSFMDLYSLVTGLIGQNGRRGALMLSLSCNHPDLEEFIGIKGDLDKVTKANISVRITDEFMKAVKEDKPFTMTFTRDETGETITKTVQAKELFKRFATMNWRTGEPGMLFWDTIEGYNLLNNNADFSYASVNPCAEEPLPAGGSCLLGSLNLAEFVKNKRFDFTSFYEAVQIAVKGMNDVLMEGMPLHPLKEQQESVNKWRQIGLGIFGLADMLIKMEITYGSPEAVDICNRIGSAMAEYALYASAMTAKNNGSYPEFNTFEVMSSSFYQAHESPELNEAVVMYGLANSQLLTIAPTGSLSTMVGVSGGIEPIFANYYTRKTESLHGEDVYYKVYTPIVDKYMKEHGIADDKDLPEWFVTAGDLDYHHRIDMQAAWQKHIDASISSTVNLPHEATVEDVEELYMYAWEKGLKGITVFRDGCERAGILTTSDPTNKAEETEDGIHYDSIIPVSRKEIGVTTGNTYCKRCACGTLYITINHDKNGNIVETFINTSKGGVCQANTNAVSRMVSTNLRSGVKVSEIADQLKGIRCPACIQSMKDGKLDGISCADILAKTLLEFYKELNPNGEPKTQTKIVTKVPEKQIEPEMEEWDGEHCPKCGAKLMHRGGCVDCPECAWSKCS